MLDWDIQSLAQGGVAPWLTAHARAGPDVVPAPEAARRAPTAYIEAAGNGYAIIEMARAQGLNPREIDAKYVAMGKDARALMVEPHSTGGRLKIGKSAFAKRSSYRGAVANHLARQVTGFRLSTRTPTSARTISSTLQFTRCWCPWATGPKCDGQNLKGWREAGTSREAGATGCVIKPTGRHTATRPRYNS